jgi:hypothetical protein
MLKSEAAWLAARLDAWPTDRGVVVNVGSSSAAFRSETQPWIEQLVCAPARARGLRIVHQDLFAADGVDVAGDLLEASCQTELRALGVFGVVCSSVLEHVTDRAAFARAIQGLLPAGGRALVTVPQRFPYHPDPIDTMFRPDVAGLLSLFPELRADATRSLRCGRLLDLVRANPARVRAREQDGDTPKRLLRDWLPYLVREFVVTCAELVRTS